MAEFPALPFFTDAYLADTIHLSTEEHGAYLLLLMSAWRTRGCYLPDDDKMLARITRTTAARWRKLRPVMQGFFDIVEDRWVQARLLKTYHDVEKRVQKNRINGAKGGRANAAKNLKKNDSVSVKSLKNNERTASNADLMLRQDQSEPLSEKGTADAAKPLATKTITKLKSESESTSESASGPLGRQLDVSADDHVHAGSQYNAAFSQIAAASELSVEKLNTACAAAWFDAGADLMRDILPTLRRLAAREKVKRGRVPSHLGYYSDAVMDARSERLGSHGTTQGNFAGNAAGGAAIGHIGAGELATGIPQSEKRRFDHTNVDDWRSFLGDGTSRFRGDYLSKHWFIDGHNPIFRAADLGPDPKRAHNPAIPPLIYREYGERWLWLGWQTAADDKVGAKVGAKTGPRTDPRVGPRIGNETKMKINTETSHSSSLLPNGETS